MIMRTKKSTDKRKGGCLQRRVRQCLPPKGSAPAIPDYNEKNIRAEVSARFGVGKQFDCLVLERKLAVATDALRVIANGACCERSRDRSREMMDHAKLALEEMAIFPNTKSSDAERSL